MDNSDHDRTDYTSAYLEFHKEWETKMSNVLDHLNESRTSDASSAVIRETEELDSKFREYPFSKQEEQSAALRSLSDVLDEARFKFTHQKKQELAEQNKLLQAQIDAWGLPPQTHQLPLSSCLKEKRQEGIRTRRRDQCEKTTH
ncbi:hypothetical protein TNCV_1604581 [Trichonephila clavipes]|nr:hypothetical protein TNCV_1604581 [Trichonephila clavipes]